MSTDRESGRGNLSPRATYYGYFYKKKQRRPPSKKKKRGKN
jgi:hypothetical protein